MNVTSHGKARAPAGYQTSPRVGDAGLRLEESFAGWLFWVSLHRVGQLRGRLPSWWLITCTIPVSYNNGGSTQASLWQPKYATSSPSLLCMREHDDRRIRHNFSYVAGTKSREN
jgi:hypothetical protein